MKEHNEGDLRITYAAGLLGTRQLKYLIALGHRFDTLDLRHIGSDLWGHLGVPQKERLDLNYPRHKRFCLSQMSTSLLANDRMYLPNSINPGPES